MEKETETKLKIRLMSICKEYGIKNASIAGDRNHEFVGMLLIDEDESERSLGSIFEAIMNVGRLWQHSRAVTRNILNEFEK